MKYADEADVLNMVMFNMTTRKWSDLNPDKKGIYVMMQVSVR